VNLCRDGSLAPPRVWALIVVPGVRIRFLGAHPLRCSFWVFRRALSRLDRCHNQHYGQLGADDVNGDGQADAIVGTDDAIVVNPDKIIVRLSNGSGFGAYEAWTAQPYLHQQGTFFADVVGDGKADAIVGNPDKITVT